MKKIYIYVACYCLFQTATFASIIEKPKILWRERICLRGEDIGRFPIIMYNGNTLALGRDNHRPSLMMKNAVTGKTLWTWTDTTLKKPELSDIDTPSIYQYSNLLVFSTGVPLYCIDLKNGQLRWKILKKENAGGLGVTGIGNTYCFPGFESSTFIGDIGTGTYKPLVSVPTRPGEIVYPKLAKLAKNASGEILAVIPFGRYNPSKNIGQDFFMLYNVSKKRVVYTIAINEPSNIAGIYGQPIIHNNKIYLAVDNSIVCHSLQNGKQVWRTKFSADFMSAGIILADNKIIGNCEDTNMYALNPETGKILWREPTTGTSCKPFYMNGVLYLLGNGDGLLHAIDTKLGEHLWRVICPEENHGVSFQGYATGENGRIFAHSYETLYCFKAAR
jgi:outer membrane protein assembly factor BamB